MPTTKSDTPQVKPASIPTATKLVHAGSEEVNALYQDTNQPMIIRQKLADTHRLLRDALAILAKLQRLSEIRQTPCYVRENGVLRKMRVEELLNTLDEVDFDKV